jgi:hypothetical protein
VAVELNYSRLDRVLHRLAFAGVGIQLTAADIERAMFGASYKAVRGAQPIFVTSLPRAGTTLMLEVLCRFPSLASHVYRDMPFVMAPMLWAHLSASFRKHDELRERAHGDGMLVGYDSPEAFEEILWRAFWPEKYHANSISLWRRNDQSTEAQEFFIEHMKKIIALRRPNRAADGRYVSKNNGNVARLDLIGAMFPDAKILIPIRRPLEHARSLLNQHRRFLEMQGQTPFVRKYMGDIGHYEFGSLHRPIEFAGFEALRGTRTPMELDYWLAYWIAAFDHILARRESLILASYEDCCLNSRKALEELCARLQIPHEGALEGAAGMFRDTPSVARGTADVNPELLDRANQLHARLLESAVGSY